MGRIWILIAVLLIVAAIPDRPVAWASPVGNREAMMRLATESWLKSQSTTGSLPYGFDFVADKATGPDDSWASIVRQAGSFWVLAEYYRYSGDSRLQEPLQRALTALGQRSLPIGKGRVQRWMEETRLLSLPFARWKLRFTLDRLGLLYEVDGPGKVVSPDGQYGSAVSGAVALALLAELTYSRASGDDRFADLRSAWLAGLSSLRIPGGGFRETPTTIDDSDYSNGEGWLALAVYGDLNRDNRNVAGMLSELDETLMKRYSDKPSSAFFHWGALAAAQRFKTTGDARFPGFLKQQAEAYFDRFHRRLDADGNNCTVMEGFAATLGALRQSGEGSSALAERIRAWLASETGKLAWLQIQPGQKGLALRGEAYLGAPRMAEFGGAFLMGLHDLSTRVDATAHCLSAMVRIERDALLSSPN